MTKEELKQKYNRLASDNSQLQQLAYDIIDGKIFGSGVVRISVSGIFYAPCNWYLLMRDFQNLIDEINNNEEVKDLLPEPVTIYNFADYLNNPIYKLYVPTILIFLSLRSIGYDYDGYKGLSVDAETDEEGRITKCSMVYMTILNEDQFLKGNKVTSDLENDVVATITF